MAAHRVGVATPPHGIALAARRTRAYREVREQFLASLCTGAAVALFLATFGVL